METKVEELQKSSDMANQENGLLRAQVERLQVELREYRKRLSWMSNGGSGLSTISSLPAAHSRGAYGLQNNEFLFDFPKFGDLPGAHLFNSSANKNDQTKTKTTEGVPRAPGVLSRDNLNGVGARTPATSKSSSSTPTGSLNTGRHNGTPGSTTSIKTPHTGVKPFTVPNQDTSTSDSPSSSSDSHHSQLLSSNGTSPEPSSHSPPDVKSNDSARGNTCIHGSIDGEESFCARLGMACGSINNPIPAAQEQKTKSNSVSSSDQPAPAPAEDTVGFDWLAQQNGGQFDPVLFGDWREPQDAVLSQDFGSFFNDAFPLPDLGSPSHNLSEVASTQPPKKDLIAQIDSKLDEEVVPGEDKSQMLTCTKIWYVLALLGRSCSKRLTFITRDRLQSMEKFRNGEIDVDNLCSELRTKARCSEGGVVVNQRDVDDIMGRAK